MSFKVVHYINQFFAQIGGEEMAHVAPELREGFVGPGMALNAAWKGEAEIVKTVVCGDSYFAEHEKEAKEQIAAAIKCNIGEIIFYQVDFYNVIISVGYRVKSKNGILFRKWANKILKDYLYIFIYEEATSINSLASNTN